MIKPIEDKLSKIPVVNVLVAFLKKIKLPGLEGLSLYDLLEMYVIGIVKGALTSRAGAIAFSFFTAIFPFLMFVLILIPYIPIDNFQTEFLVFLESFLPPNTSDFFKIANIIARNRIHGIKNSKNPSLFMFPSIISIGDIKNTLYSI